MSSGYACPTCGRKSKLPDSCCDQAMVRQGVFYCDKCNSQSNKEGSCCGMPRRQL